MCREEAQGRVGEIKEGGGERAAFVFVYMQGATEHCVFLP